jgi:exopolyphosphatase/guanosine-5'-triphosphate,3'-diphosphate pyrophosphatase
MVVFRVVSGGVLEVVVDEHAPLQLIRAIGKDGRLSDEAMDRAVVMLRDFRQVALAAGATVVRAFGTAALREAVNREELFARTRRESGVEIHLLGSDEEGRDGFLGAVYGLPVYSGLVFDIGGGSVQLMHFRNRKLTKTCSLPLGALRVSDEFLKSDPPTPSQVKKLRAHVRRLLRRAKIGLIDEDDSVVGTGGTVRNLAKVDTRRWSYPITRLHGYNLTYARLRELTAVFLGRDSKGRAELPGLNRQRADSIVGGSIVAAAILDACGASHFLVSGQGMREGTVLARTGAGLPDPDKVRAASVAAFAARFATCEPLRAKRRLQITLSLYDQLEPYPEPTWREMLGHAANLFDAGRSIDYYKMQMHTAAMVRSSGLAGFSHRGITLVSSMIETSDPDGWDPHICSPPLGEDDYDALERAGLLLCLSDIIEKRRLAPAGSRVSLRTTGREFILREPGMTAWKESEVSKRFRNAFGRELKIGR